MICPYNRKTETHFTGWSQTPNEDNVLTRGVTMEQWHFEMQECQKENCGAWHNGKCCYASVNLENE